MSKENASTINNLSFEHDNIDQRIKGFQEAVLSVIDIDDTISFYKKVFGWEVLYKGQGSAALKKLWQLPEHCLIDEVLLYNPGTKEGFLRLVSFSNIDQTQIRASAQTWDTGGIFDINVRTKDMSNFYSDILNVGWHGYADPLRYTFGEYEVTEVLLKTPEGATVAVMERHRPALVGFEFERISRIFNSSIITDDIEKSRDFYINKLGFKMFFQTPGDQRPHGPNVLGIPPNINGDITVPVDIYRPDIDSFGSIEVLELKQLRGKDCSAGAKPPNLGLVMLRFPVRDVAVYVEELEQKGVSLNAPVQTIDIHPYGKTKTFSVRSPEGAWLEFIELLN